MDRLVALTREPQGSLGDRLRDVRPAGDWRDLQLAVLGAVAALKPLSVVADLLCREAEPLGPGLTWAVFALEESGALRPVAGPRLPAGYAEALHAVAGAPELRPPVIDLAADEPWDQFSGALRKEGVWACCPLHVFARGKRPVGLLAVHLSEFRDLTRLERDLALCCARLAALAIGQDVLRTSLEVLNHRLDVALGSISQGVCFFDGAQRLILANPRYAEIYGLDASSMQPGMALAEIVALRVAVGSGPAMTATQYLDWRDSMQLAGGDTQSVVELTNGKTIAIHHKSMPDHGWVGTHEDITARKQAEARVLHMARHDPLTGLANRTLFQEQLEQVLQRARLEGREAAVLCLDLDRFKPVNDSLGHPAGDKLLKAVAGRLLGCVREGDTVTRLGGDEFAILVPELDGPERVRDLAERVIHAVGHPFQIDGTTINIGTSVGVALSQDPATTPEELFGNADIALYRAKAEQRGTFRFFEAEMQSHMQSRQALERDLRVALAGGQFELFYQPLVNLQRDAVSAFEALIRWHHPEQGLLSPVRFIPLAEETGLIVPIGAWVLRQACADAARWPADITVCVNLSPAQFKTSGLVASVREALGLANLPATRLELEITETLLLENNPFTRAALHELAALGVRISMDDFGTGHSSLSYLRSFPFHKIKIDQSFIHDLPEREDSMAIVRAILGLGQSLHMVTTAEGVETKEQLERLREAGCVEVQGYLFSQPRPASDIAIMMRSPRA